MSEELKAALARIACLEGEIAKQDEELAACRVAVENCEVFRARIVELESASESLRLSRDYHHERENEYRRRWACLYAAPVSEAKAHGVVKWPEADEIMQMAFEEGQPADDASGYYFELEEFDLFIERLMSEVARLNAAPVQQVSVPDVSAMARILADRNADACNVNREDNWAIYGQDYIDDVTAMLAAAPAAGSQEKA